VKDAVNSVFWLSRTPWPKSGNRRVLEPYSDAMNDLLENGYNPKLRPSGHDISHKFGKDNKGAIPSNLLAVANTESNSAYLRYCKANGLKPHPARFPAAIPEFFLRFLTDPGDLVLDPFAGSCVSGEVSEKLDRRWICTEIEETYLLGAKGRFGDSQSKSAQSQVHRGPGIGSLWDSLAGETLSQDGGRTQTKQNSVGRTITENTNALKFDEHDSKEG